MATYYVATTGNDSNDGSIGSPWLSITHACGQVVAGDIVNIRTGTYSETLVPSSSGTNGNPITFKNYTGETVTLTGAGYARPGTVAIGFDMGQDGQNPGYNGTARNYIIVDGLNITYTNAAYFRFGAGQAHECTMGYVYVYGAHNTIRNCHIYESGSYDYNFTHWQLNHGIGVSSATDTLIENNNIHEMEFGIFHYNGGPVPCRNIIRGNTIHHTGQSPIDIGSPTLAQSANGNQGILIENNILSCSLVEDMIQFEPDYAHVGDTPVPVTNLGVVIRNNILCYAAENAMDLKGAGNVVAEGNIVYGCRGENEGGYTEDSTYPKTQTVRNRTGGLGFLIAGNYGKTAGGVGTVIARNNVVYDNYGGTVILKDNWALYNNTMLANNRDYTGPNSTFYNGTDEGFDSITCYGANISCSTIINNIMAEQVNSQLDLAASFMGSKNVVDYNLYSNTSSFWNYDTANNVKKTTLADWQSYLTTNATHISGGDAHAQLVTDIKFVKDTIRRPYDDFTQYDFDLSSGSPAINSGGPLTYAAGGGTGTAINVISAAPFFDGYNITDADHINVGTNVSKSISSIDYVNNIITLNSSITWSDGDPVYLSFIGSSSIGATFFTGSAYLKQQSSRRRRVIVML